MNNNDNNNRSDSRGANRRFYAQRQSPYQDGKNRKQRRAERFAGGQNLTANVQPQQTTFVFNTSGGVVNFHGAMPGFGTQVSMPSAKQPQALTYPRNQSNTMPKFNNEGGVRHRSNTQMRTLTHNIRENLRIRATSSQSHNWERRSKSPPTHHRREERSQSRRSRNSRRREHNRSRSGRPSGIPNFTSDSNTVRLRPPILSQTMTTNQASTSAIQTAVEPIAQPTNPFKK